ncbi:hypothetical protein HanIR_Chr12g0602261 [Helianthus annuus]|nr:hypothetical protein HanIR_Chr12g0602261 [Helianthus annuus]
MAASSVSSRIIFNSLFSTSSGAATSAAFLFSTRKLETLSEDSTKPQSIFAFSFCSPSLSPSVGIRVVEDAFTGPSAACSTSKSIFAFSFCALSLSLSPSVGIQVVEDAFAGPSAAFSTSKDVPETYVHFAQLNVIIIIINCQQNK